MKKEAVREREKCCVQTMAMDERGGIFMGYPSTTLTFTWCGFIPLVYKITLGDLTTFKHDTKQKDLFVSIDSIRA